MKKISLLFLVSFSFFVLGQIFWMIGMLSKSPLFGSPHLEEWIIWVSWTNGSIFGLLGSYKWYQDK